MTELLLSILILRGQLTAPRDMSNSVPLRLAPSVTQQLQQLTTGQCMWMRDQSRLGSWFEMTCYVNAGCLDTVCIKGKKGYFDQCVIVEESPNCS